MNRLTNQELNELLRRRADPCISFYLPVEKVGQDTRQGTIRLKKMIRSTTQELRNRNLRPQAVEELLQPVEGLLDNTLFWEHQEQGLALFLDETGLVQHALHQPCEESVTISDHFMVLPLLTDLAIDDAYYVLALSLDDTRLYRTTRTSIAEINLPEPRSLKAITNTYDLEKQLQHHSPSKRKGGTIFHGSDSVKDQEKLRIEEFFRHVDNSLHTILAGHKPVVIACVDYLFPIFQSVCHNIPVADQHISGSPENMKKEELLTRSWDIIQPEITRDQTIALNHYQDHTGTDRIAQSIGQILPAAIQGRVDTLFISRGSRIWGDWDETTGEVLTLYDQPKHFGDPDLLSHAARLTVVQSGNVYVLDADEMPERLDCAALFRF